MKNIFVCHRPYHILRSCDLIKSENRSEDCNVLINFDVLTGSDDVNKRFDSNRIFYPTFNEVIEIQRNNPPSPRDLFKYLQYCKGKKSEYRSIVRKHLDFDRIYFYCDDELEIEILVSLFLQSSKHNVVSTLVDEGLVTYEDTQNRLTRKGQLYHRLLYKIAGLSNCNWKRSYGSSNLYNNSIANCPERASFKDPILRMQPLSEDTLHTFRASIPEPIRPPNDKPYFLYIGTYEKSFEIEEPVLNSIIEILTCNNVDVFIKLHPQQDEKPYEIYANKATIIDKSYPIELFFGKNAIVGGTISSAIYNAYLQGFNALILSKLFGLDVEPYLSWTDITAVDSYDMFENTIKEIIKKGKK